MKHEIAYEPEGFKIAVRALFSCAFAFVFALFAFLSIRWMSGA
jgi:hypothetical protein